MKGLVLWLLLFPAPVVGADTRSLIQRVPPQAAVANPFAGNADAARSGSKLFARECASCHGLKGEGIGKAPPLAFGEVANAEPGALFWILRNGSLKRGMPSFAHLPEPQRWQIVTYLQTIPLR